MLQCSPQPGTSTGQEGGEKVASEGAVLVSAGVKHNTGQVT